MTSRSRLAGALDGYAGRLLPLVGDLGGHDLADILDALRQARATTDRPTVIFAYTIKGYGLEIAGRPQNHSALLNGEQVDRFRAEVGADAGDPSGTDSRPRAWRGSSSPLPPVRLDRGQRPHAAGDRGARAALRRDPPRISTQAAFGRILLDLSRVDGVGERLVTISPDVSVSTNLGGFINKTGVWGLEDERVYDAMEDSPLRWRVGRTGQHVEMGIAEMNLVLALGQLGLTWDFQRERLFPIGTLYDPFVMRALEGIVYSVYSGARFVLCGTPSGISLGREGGAHQSLNTPGIGLETPGITYCEPAYARELEWLLLDGLARMQEPDGEALYVRLSTKPLEQAPFTLRPRVEARNSCARTSSRADFVSASPVTRRPTTASCSPPVAPSCRRRSRPRSSSRPRRACTPPCSASPAPIVCTTTGSAPARSRCATAGPPLALTSTCSWRPASVACPSSP